MSSPGKVQRYGGSALGRPPPTRMAIQAGIGRSISAGKVGNVERSNPLPAVHPGIL
jgi:hypothetical protein